MGAAPLARTRGKGWPLLPPSVSVSSVARARVKDAGALSDVAEWKEYHSLVARGSADASRSDGARWWRWEGHLVRYVVLDDRSDKNSEEPPLMLVHGFGASADQWRRLAAELRRRPGGPSRVVAVDILGFGMSAKPGLSYTQHLWEAFLVDFVEHGPLDWLRTDAGVVLAGNSIGGGLSAGAAANLGRRCAGLVLCNTAGELVSDSEIAAGAPLDVRQRTLALLRKDAQTVTIAPYSPPVSQGLLDAFGETVISALRPQIASLLVKYYGTNPANADVATQKAIERDALDPGAANVIGSGAKLPPQRSLNEVLADFDGPVLVPQGALDLVSGEARARQRADELSTLRPGIDVRLLESGHCPHDETPELVADAILDWWPAVRARAKANA